MECISKKKKKIYNKNVYYHIANIYEQYGIMIDTLNLC